MQLSGVRRSRWPHQVPRCLGITAGWRAACAALGLWAWPEPALAQTMVSEAQIGLSTGLEGSDTGVGPAWQRARTRVVVGLDMGNDEWANEAYGLRAFVELERTVSVGAELGYIRWFLPELSFFFGGVGVFAPKTLFGGTVEATYTLPMGKRFGIPIWAGISALPFGSDRGNDGVVIWTLLGVGVRGRL